LTRGLFEYIFIGLLVSIGVAVVVVFLLSKVYRRATKEQAFVRTGQGGQRVVIDGGAFVIPILHEVTPVSLGVVRIPIARVRDQAVSTRDRMRIDIEAEFFVRVIQERSAVAAAASTLGRRTVDHAQLADLLSGKFVGAIRSSASEMTLDEIHEKRSELIDRVAARAASALAQNGLELEAVAITDLDQTSLEHFDPANRFDAEGMTQLIEAIETRRQLRNDIEQTTMLAIRTRNLEVEKETLRLDEASESARLAQEQALERQRAGQRMEIARTRIEQEAQAEAARIQSEQALRERDIVRQKVLESAEIRAREEVELARLSYEKALEKSRVAREGEIRQLQIHQAHEIDASEIAANEDLERARIVSQRQLREARVIADVEMVEREISRDKQAELARIMSGSMVESTRLEQEKAIETARLLRDRTIRAEEIVHREAVERAEIASREGIEGARIAMERALDEARIRRDGELQRLELDRQRALELVRIENQIVLLVQQSSESEAKARSEASRARAVEAEEGVNSVRETVIAKRIAEVDRLIARKQADTAMIAAEADRLAADVAAHARRLLNEAENCLSEDARATRLREKMVDRLEGIVRESVRPLERIEGIKIVQVNGLAGPGGGGARSPTDEVIESALRYRAQAPLIDQMMKDIGVQNANVAGMGDMFRSARDAQELAKEARKTADDHVAKP
jgi:uncharacterized membrane protein YqiK